MLAHALEAIGLSQVEHGRWDEARRLLNESLELRRRVYGVDHPLTARGLNNLGALEYQAGNLVASDVDTDGLDVVEGLGRPDYSSH